MYSFSDTTYLEYFMRLFFLYQHNEFIDLYCTLQCIVRAAQKLITHNTLEKHVQP